MLATKDTIGRMDRKLTFKKRVTETNTQYNTEDRIGWEDVDSMPTVATEKMNLVGTEAYEGFQLTEISSARFRIRYRTDITVMNIIVFEGLVYQIIAPPKETTRRRYMEIIAEQKGVYQEDDSGNGFTIGFSIGFRS